MRQSRCVGRRLKKWGGRLVANPVSSGAQVLNYFLVKVHYKENVSLCCWNLELCREGTLTKAQGTATFFHPSFILVLALF